MQWTVPDSGRWLCCGIPSAVPVLLLGLLLTTMETAADDQQLFDQVNTIPELVAQGKLSPDQIPNPHWRDGACHACHRGDPNARPVKLREENVDQLCQFCHTDDIDHAYIHPINVKPDSRMIARMPSNYRDAINIQNGELSCTTCHKLTIQCLTRHRSERGLNPRFFRGGPFRTRAEQCYFCHDADQYERLNPHKQISEDGQMRQATCQICHKEDINTLQGVRGIDNLLFYNKSDLKLMCIGCHPWKPHPGGTTYTFRENKNPPDHLVRPDAKILQRMQQQTAINGISLPLEPGSGKIFCATCHDPHQQGVINNKNNGDKVETKNRLRTTKICLNCHDK